jgi:DNA-binding transcriptional ArsR family regulator
MEERVFKALGDPVRLKIISRLSDGLTHTIGSLTTGLGMSRQGARKQIEVLVFAKIVRLRPRGREVNVLLDIKALKSARDTITEIENKWDERLKRLKEVVEKVSDKRI